MRRLARKQNNRARESKTVAATVNPSLTAAAEALLHSVPALERPAPIFLAFLLLLSDPDINAYSQEMNISSQCNTSTASGGLPQPSLHPKRRRQARQDCPFPTGSQSSRALVLR